MITPTQLKRSPRQWFSILFEAFLIVLTLIGISYRFRWVNWNQDTNLHPDEYGLTYTLIQLNMPKTPD